MSGGLGAAVASLVVEHEPVPMRILGVARRVRADRQHGIPARALRPHRDGDRRRGPRPQRRWRSLTSACSSPSTRARARPRPCSSTPPAAIVARGSRAGRPADTAARLGRAVRRGDLGQRSGSAVAACLAGHDRRGVVGRRPAAHSASRSCCGSATAARRSARFSAGRTSARRRHARRCAPAVRRAGGRGQRAAARPDVLRAEGALAARPLRPAPHTQSARRAVPGHGRLLVAQPLRRRARDRGGQRLTHAAARCPTLATGTRSFWSCSVSRRRSCPASCRRADRSRGATGLAPLR